MTVSRDVGREGSGEVVCGELTMTASRLSVSPETGDPREVVAPAQMSFVERCP